MPESDIRIGTSGWHYADWWGPFFPKEVRKKDALGYYASQFCATELNAPFYRSPSLKAVQNWYDQTPEDFRFAWKGPRYISHFKRLLCDDYSLELLELRLSGLKHKLGPVLFQLPPQFHANAGRLDAFLGRLHSKHRYSFEFRHPTWYCDDVFSTLRRRHNAALCISDHADAPAPREVTSKWTYIRLHGTSGRYHGSYSDEALRDWANFISDCRAHGRDVWCFFDNDMKSAAPGDAVRLRETLNET